MAERCPLSVGSVPGFYYFENIPEICHETCEHLWEAAIKSAEKDHEEYPDSILVNPECPHISTEYGNSSLQTVLAGSAIRFFGISERCMECEDEIAEDVVQFECPRP